MNDEIVKCYEALDLEPGASTEAVKQAYRELVKVWHPDRFSHDPKLQSKAQERLKEINLAYEKIMGSSTGENRSRPTGTAVQKAEPLSQKKSGYSKILVGFGILALVVLAGVVIGSFGGHGFSGPTPIAQSLANSESHSSPEAEMHPAPVSQPAGTDVEPVATSEPVPLVQTSNLTLAATNAANTETNWEEKIDDIVGSDEPDTNKVKQLFALFPKLPEDGQEEAAQHLSNLVEDDDYKPLGDLLKNDKLPEGVLDELLADVLNRPNATKLPLLLDVASDADHAKKDEAKDLLELYLGEDYGSDWNSWGQHMTNWMQQNPD